MENGSNGKISYINKEDVDIRIKRYKLWTAIAVLIAALIPTLTTLIQIEEVLRSIKVLAEKPLEGEWAYESKYEKYYDEIDPHMLQGTGKAIIIWKNLDKRYEVNISYGITRAGEEKPLLASFLQGTLEANDNGFPVQKDFNIDRLAILNRVHYKGTPATKKIFNFKNCNFTKDMDEKRVQSITCIFETPISKSNVTLTLDKTLH